MPKVSVIIPVYNVEKYLRQCLDSVVNQTLKDIEIICVNDCSSDNSLSIIQEYAKNDNRFVIINQEKNQGQGIARNKAIDIAKGEYIMFLDADDWYELNACELAYNQISINRNDLCLFGFYNNWMEKNTKIPAKYMIKPYEKYINYPNIDLISSNIKNYIVCMYTVMYIYSRDFLNTNSIRYGTEHFGEDSIFYIKAIMLANSFSVLDKYIYNYRRHKASTTAIGANLYSELICSRQQVYEWIKEYKPERVNDYIGYYIKTILLWYKRLTAADKSIKKDYYTRMREIFIYLDKKYDISEYKEYIKYSEFEKIVKNNWYQIMSKEICKTLFSVDNSKDKKNKIITILGLKIKFKKRISYSKTQKNYKINVNKIKEKYNKNEKIKVLFLSSENSKWGYNSLYKKFAQDEHFEPIVGIFPLKRIINNKDNIQQYQEEQYNFYKKLKISVQFLFDNDFIDIKNLKPDIVFYQQRWSLPFLYKPYVVSKYALTFACPYSYTMLDEGGSYNNKFHRYLYRYYAENELTLKMKECYTKGASKNSKIVGFPKLDEYIQKKPVDLKKYWKNPEKIKVIYAPHHSVDTEKKSLQLSTFIHNGRLIQNYAKTHPETTWVFKPHPRLKFALLKNNIMTKEEIDDYFDEWENLGVVYTQGDYLDIFKSSDMMITDCCSFLAEYLPSGKPLIRMINKNGIKLNKSAQKICSQYYLTNNNNELLECLNMLIENNQDIKKEKRLELIDFVFDKNESAADKIYKDVLSILEV